MIGYQEARCRKPDAQPVLLMSSVRSLRIQAA
jgi:hypothetical protein